jgi:two-component system alkaline phosphatase synthesis response regulator PhoP
MNKVEVSQKILVIDDEPEITDIVKTYFDSLGYNVAVANSGEEGLGLAPKFRPHLVLLDIMMPETSGYEVCNELKRMPELTGVPVVFLTGRDTREDSGRSFQAGGDMFVKKPFSCERLAELVKIALTSVVK